MTDEAFIRSVVDSPGDDLPRLAYADWLDERSDPRGPYLRAERERAKPWRDGGRPVVEPRLRALAAGLDPVWVARVSRPPLGVCSAHLALSTTEERVQHAELSDAESELGVDLPAQLRALLLNYTLGHLRGGPFVMRQPGEPEGVAIDGFVSLTDPSLTEGEVSCELVDRTQWEWEECGLGKHYVFLAETFYDTVFVVSCHAADCGAVFEKNDLTYSDPDTALTLVAESVGEFLATLEPRSWPLTDA